MAISDEDTEVLYAFESVINSAAHEDSTLLDLHVLDALELTRRALVAESQGRTVEAKRTDPRTHELFVGLRAVGQSLLGEASAERLVSSIRKLEKSVKLWSEQGGRRGYLSYIAGFLPQP